MKAKFLPAALLKSLFNPIPGYIIYRRYSIYVYILIKIAYFSSTKVSDTKHFRLRPPVRPKNNAFIPKIRRRPGTIFKTTPALMMFRYTWVVKSLFWDLSSDLTWIKGAVKNQNGWYLSLREESEIKKGDNCPLLYTTHPTKILNQNWFLLWWKARLWVKFILFSAHNASRMTFSTVFSKFMIIPTIKNVIFGHSKVIVHNCVKLSGAGLWHCQYLRKKRASV